MRGSIVLEALDCLSAMDVAYTSDHGQSENGEVLLSNTVKLNRLLHQAMRVTGAPMGNLQVLDGDLLRIRVHHGFEKPFLEFFSEVNHDIGSCGSALHSQSNVVVQDVKRSEIFSGNGSLAVMLRAGVRACQSTPIFAARDSVVGMLNTHHARPRSFSPDELAEIKRLAEQASSLLVAPISPTVTSPEHQGWNRIALDGEWDISHKRELAELFSGLNNEGPAIIDLTHATYFDSTVLNALATLRNQFKELPITLVGPNKNVLQILKIANFDKLFRIVEHE